MVLDRSIVALLMADDHDEDSIAGFVAISEIFATHGYCLEQNNLTESSVY